MAPQPKPPGARQRRNVDQPGWETLTADDVAAETPTWPGRKPPAAAQRYWEAIWSSPVSGMYLPIDVPGLIRTCRLHAKTDAGKASGAEMAELRQLEQLYGLSPKARRSLQWEVERAAGKGAAATEQPVDRLQRNRDRKSSLSVVAKKP